MQVPAYLGNLSTYTGVACVLRDVVQNSTPARPSKGPCMLALCMHACCFARATRRSVPPFRLTCPHMYCVLCDAVPQVSADLEVFWAAYARADRDA